MFSFNGIYHVHSLPFSRHVIATDTSFFHTFLWSIRACQRHFIPKCYNILMKKSCLRLAKQIAIFIRSIEIIIYV